MSAAIATRWYLKRIITLGMLDWLIRTKADENSSPFSGGTEKYFFEVGGSVGFVPIGPQSLSRLSFMVEGLN